MFLLLSAFFGVTSKQASERKYIRKPILKHIYQSERVGIRAIYVRAKHSEQSAEL
jgi:hypothetical protein